MNWLLLNAIISASITLLFGLVFRALYWQWQELEATRHWAVAYFLLVIAMSAIGVRVIFPQIDPYALSGLLAASAGIGCFYLYCGIRLWRRQSALSAKTKLMVVVPMVLLGALSPLIHAVEPFALVASRIYIGGFSGLAIVALMVGGERTNLGHSLAAAFLVAMPVSQLLSFYMVFFDTWGPDGIAAVSVAHLLESPLSVLNFVGLPIGFTGIGLFCMLGILLDVGKQLREESIRDWLTGCYNRRGFIELAEKLFSQSRRRGSNLTLILLDMDNFKEINDNHGHDAGDQALQQVAGMLKSRVRDGDVLARWGGEEFIVLLPDAEERDALGIAETLRIQIERKPLCLDAGVLQPMTASFGVAQRNGADKGIDAMVTRADTALYRSKSQGKNCVTRAQPLNAVP